MGSILKDPLRPDEPITCKVPAPLPHDIHIERSCRTNWEEIRERVTKGRFGVWAQFLQYIGKGDASVGWMIQHGDEFKFQSLDTEWFLPPLDFVKDQIKLPLVEAYVNTGSIRPDVYMITAIMIARGASMKQTKTNEGGFSFKLGADLTAAGAPGVTVGPDLWTLYK